MQIKNTLITPIRIKLKAHLSHLSEQLSKRTQINQSEWLRSKSLQVINAGEGVEKREPSYTVGGNAN